MKKIFTVICALAFSANLIGNNVQWSSPPVSLSSTNVDSSNASLSMDPNGNIVSIWLENGVVKARARLVNAGWGNVIILSGPSASSPSVVSDNFGNTTAVWVEGGVVKAATKHFNSSWAASVALSAAGSSAPSIAVDAAGDTMVAWARAGNIQTATKLFGANWQTAVSIASNTATAPVIAMGGTGSGAKAVVVWNAVSNSIPVVCAASKTVTGSWGSPQILSDTNHGAVNPSVAVDANANAVAVWYGYDLLGPNYFNVALHASYMMAGGAWGLPVAISEEGFSNPAKLMTKVVFDASGNAVAMWNNSPDGATYNIEAAVKLLRSDWGAPAALVSLNPYAYQFGLTGTEFGDALTAFMFYNGTSLLIQACESDFSGFVDNDWGVPTNMSSGTNNGYPNVAAAVSANVMHAASIWIKNTGGHNIVYAVTGSKNLLLPPTNLTVSQSSHNMGIFTEYYNTVSWTASSSPDIAGYIIYRNGAFLTEVDEDTLQYVDPNRVQAQSATYGIAAVDTQGSVSKIVSVNYL